MCTSDPLPHSANILPLRFLAKIILIAFRYHSSGTPCTHAVCSLLDRIVGLTGVTVVNKLHLPLVA
jgi:hypothetical protein